MQLTKQIMQLPTALLLFMAIGLSFVNSENCKPEAKLEYCKNPLKDPNFDPVWMHQNYPVTPSPFLLANRAYRDHFTRLLRGRELTDDENFSGLCAGTVFNNTASSVGGNYFGFGNLSYYRNCSNSAGTISCEFTSNENPNYKESAKVYMSYYGPKTQNNYLIVVYCLDNGDSGWALCSLRKKLPIHEIASALKHIQSRGFDMEDVVTPYEDSCENGKLL